MVEKNSDGSKKVQSSSSTSYISSLSDELLVEILCRLGSSKYATQCKCICKRWFALINPNTHSSLNSYFLRRWKHFHHKEGEELAMALLTSYRDSLTGECSVVDYFFQPDKELLPTFKPLNFLPNIVDPPCILATFKDLVLCCPNKEDHSVYYICNPITRQWTALPPPNNWYINTSITKVGLIVSNDGEDFKVVRVIPYYPFETDRKSFLVPLHSEKTKAEIFSSDDSTSGWKEMFVPEISSLQFCSYDGMLVWLSLNHIYGFGFNSNFDAPDNVNSYARFSLPLDINLQLQRPPYTRLGVCKGRLRIAQFVSIAPLNVGQNVDYGLKLSIWELNSPSQSSWELIHELNFSEMKDSLGSRVARSCYQQGLGLWSTILALHPRDGDILYLALYSQSINAVGKLHTYLFSCNARRRTLKAIRVISGTPQSCIAFTLLQPSWPTSVPLLAQFE